MFDGETGGERAILSLTSRMEAGRGSGGCRAPTDRQRPGETERRLLPSAWGVLQAGVDSEDLKLALRLKEVELQTKNREVELMHLRIKALELEGPARPAP